MEKTVKAIGIIKWLGFPLGYLMYFVTSGSFGETVGMVLGVLATVSFWFMMRRESTRMIGQTIAVEIKKAISDVSNVENVIEIKKLKSGLIARVYLINSRDKSVLIHRAITRQLEQCSFKRYLWVMQLTDIPSKKNLKETQKLLNEQLLEELMKKREEDK